MNIKELVARLRGAETTLGESLCFGLVGEAADMIEAQAREIAELQLQRKGNHFAQYLIEKNRRQRFEEENESLHQICRTIYEVWAGSEGIPEPETACEAYLLQLVLQMKDEAKGGLK